jgi:hypothetical protein
MSRNSKARNGSDWKRGFLVLCTALSCVPRAATQAVATTSAATTTAAASQGGGPPREKLDAPDDAAMAIAVLAVVGVVFVVVMFVVNAHKKQQAALEVRTCHPCTACAPMRGHNMARLTFSAVAVHWSMGSY